ncbi:hypothetical protein Tco_0093772 [Tanacetum coccineum]
MIQENNGKYVLINRGIQAAQIDKSSYADLEAKANDFEVEISKLGKLPYKYGTSSRVETAFHHSFPVPNLKKFTLKRTISHAVRNCTLTISSICGRARCNHGIEIKKKRVSKPDTIG